MSEKFQHPLFEQTMQYIETLPDDVFEGLSSVQKETREKAVQLVLKPLFDTQPQDASTTLQIIPLCLAQNGDYSAALGFIETIVSGGRYISLETIQAVYSSTLDELAEAEIEEDFEFTQEINAKIKLLISSTQDLSNYAQDINFLLLVGKECERIGEFEKAQTFYEKMIELEHEEGYLHLGLLYKKRGEYSEALACFEEGENIYKSQVYTENRIIALAEMGDLEKAKTLYGQLKEVNVHISPFVFYSLRIESDDDLIELEENIDKSVYGVHTLVAQIIQKASEYIKEHIIFIDTKLMEFVHKGVEKLDDNEAQEVQTLMQRKLYLMSYDINILKDSRYLLSHLLTLNTMAFSGDEFKKAVLRDFFEGINNEGINSKEDENDIPFKNSLYYQLHQYLSKILQKHFHGKNFEVMTQQLIPLMLRSLDEIQLLEDYEAEYMHLRKRVLWERDFLQSFPKDIGKLYDTLTYNIDQIYGKNLRVSLAQVARHDEMKLDAFAHVLQENPNLACFFFIEQIIGNNFLSQAPENQEKVFSLIDELIEKYKLLEVDTDTAILFAEALLRVDQIEHAAIFLVNARNTLEDTLGVYTILKILSHTDEENKKILLHDFDNICQETFEIASFYEYIEGFIQEISEESDLSDEERQHLLLSYGLLKQLQESSNYEQDAFLLFKKAGEIGNIEGYLYMGNLLFQNAQYDESIQIYEQALLIQPSLNTLLLLLKSALIGEKFDIVSQYIDYGITQNYEMSGAILSLLLFQNKPMEALGVYISLQNRGLSQWEFLGGLAQIKLQNLIEKSLLLKEYSLQNIKQKIFANYIAFIHNRDYKYLTNILEILHHTSGEDFLEGIHETFSVILGNDVSLESENIEEQAMEYIDLFLSFYHTQLREEFEQFQQSQNVQAIEKHFHLMNSLSGFGVSLLSRFQNHEDYTEKWKLGIKFVKYEGHHISDEQQHSSPTLH